MNVVIFLRRTSRTSTGKYDRPCVAKPINSGVRSESDNQQ